MIIKSIWNGLIISLVLALGIAVKNGVANENTPSNASLPSGVINPTVAQWLPLMQKSSTKYDVPLDMIVGIMTVESAGDPTAVSYAGAEGLLQMMPETKGDVCPGKDMFIPKISIDCGVKYMRWLLDNTGGDTDIAIMAYHGGLGNGRKGGRPVDRGYLVSVKSASSKFSGQHKYLNVVSALYGGGGYRMSQGNHDGYARDYVGNSRQLYAPISGKVISVMEGYVVDQRLSAREKYAGTSALVIVNEITGEKVILYHGNYIVSVGDEVVAGFSPIGQEYTNGYSSGIHSHIEYQINGVAQQLP